MNMYTNTKKTKKLILVLVLLILFNFCYPKNVKAWIELEDVVAAPAMIFWMIEKGLLTFLNNLFVKEDLATAPGFSYVGAHRVDILNIKLTPENIIKGRFLLFDADIFKEIDGNAANYYYDLESDSNDNVIGYVGEGRIALRNTISGWYYALRNLAIIALLSVLVYVGIRMILSTIAQDKAKYKTMFKDWLVALCLVVVMHYMMITILHITSLITEALGSGENSNMLSDLAQDISGILSDEGDSNDYTFNDMTLSDAYTKIVVVAGIIGYTFIFAVKYLKREFTIIFLILLGPVSCITYPIDKISDGKAQAFNKWFSEFLYQVIIQPFHLLLYIVLIGSAVELANSNVIYALVCFAVMIPAEKFVKEMFGFKDKLGSPLGAFAGGALASQLLNKAFGGVSSVGKSIGGKNNSDEDSESKLPTRTKDLNLTENEGNNRGENTSIDVNRTSELNSGDNNTTSDNDNEVDNNESHNTDIDNRFNDLDSASDNNNTVIDEGDDSDSSETYLLDEGEAGTVGDGETDQAGSKEGNIDTDKGDDIESDENLVNGETEEADEEGNIDTDKGDGIESDENIVEGETDQVGGNVDDGATDQEGGEEPEKKGILNNLWGATKATGGALYDDYRKNTLKKYGVMNGKGLAKKRALGLLKTTSRFAGKTLKGATTLTAGLAGGVALGMVGAMFGQGMKGAALGIGLGSKVGKGVGNIGEKAVKYTGKKAGVAAKGVVDYINPDIMKNINKNAAENKDKEKYMSNSTNIARAQRNIEARTGEEANAEDINNELNSMYEMSQYGVEDKYMDRAMDQYNNNKALGMGDSEALKFATASALDAQTYSAKDFKDEKLMEKKYDDYYNQFKSAGFSDELANERAANILNGAGAMKGVNNVPLPTERVTINAGQEEKDHATQTLNSRGIDKPTQRQLKQEVELNRTLESAGYTPEQVLRLSQMAKNSNIGYETLVERTIKAKADWQKPENATLQEAVGENYEPGQPEQEIIERMEWEALGVQDQDKISDLRNLNIDALNKDDFENEQIMDKLYTDYNKAFQNAGYSAETADNRARQIILDAGASKGVSEVSLPKERVQLSSEQVKEYMPGIEIRGKGKGSNNVIKQEIEVHKEFISSGFDDKQFEKVVDMARNNKVDQKQTIERVIKVSADWKQGKQTDTTKELVNAIGKGATNKEANVEIIERMEYETRGVKNQSKISRLREIENNIAKGDANAVKENREYVDKAIKNGGKLSELDKAKVDKEINAFAELAAESVDNEN